MSIGCVCSTTTPTIIGIVPTTSSNLCEITFWLNSTSVVECATTTAAATNNGRNNNGRNNNGRNFNNSQRFVVGAHIGMIFSSSHLLRLDHFDYMPLILTRDNADGERAERTHANLPFSSLAKPVLFVAPALDGNDNTFGLDGAFTGRPK